MRTAYIPFWAQPHHQNSTTPHSLHLCAYLRACILLPWPIKLWETWMRTNFVAGATNTRSRSIHSPLPFVHITWFLANQVNANCNKPFLLLLHIQFLPFSNFYPTALSFIQSLLSSSFHSKRRTHRDIKICTCSFLCLLFSPQCTCCIMHL